MIIGALSPYERSLDGLLDDDGLDLSLETVDGRTFDLDLRRYLSPCDSADETVLARCDGPVIDIGCGPGRMLHALRSRGIPALGIDIATTAVHLSRSGGGVAMERDVFSLIPGEGEWVTALIMDGNVGIGGDADRLLARANDLVEVGGRVIVETAEDCTADETLRVRFARNGTAIGPFFGWALVGSDALGRRAEQTGFDVDHSWSAGGRSFVELVVNGRSRMRRIA